MSVPFFKDFTKKTKGFFQQKRRDEYDLGQSINFKLKNSDFTLKGKLKSNDNNLDQKLTFIFKRKFGEIEIEENGSKISAKIDVPKIYKDIDLETKHTNKEVNLTVKYKPKGSYYNARVKGDYIPDKDGVRICKCNGSFAVGDDSLNLSVGGEFEVTDKNGAQDNKYKLGFLYTPNKDSQYSVLYNPDKNDGLEYEFDLYRKFNESCDIAARATGKVDTSILNTEKPIINLGAGFNLSEQRRLQGFVNSEREYGFLFKTNFTPQSVFTFGVAAYKDVDGEINPRLGYKLEI